MVRNELGLKAPRGWGWLTNPKKAAYNRIYNRTTVGCGTFLLIILMVIALSLFTCFTAFARGGHGGSHSGGHSSKSYSSKSYSTKSHSNKSGYRQHTSKASYGVQRDSRGRIKRSSAAKHDFMKQSGYPNGRPGYVVDHRVPLKRGGSDSPGNMQWQTKADAKAKDKWE
jgi:hypothetical protein